MFMMNREKLKPKLQLSEDFLNLKMDKTNVIIEHLEEQIKLREMGLEKQLKKQLKHM